MCIRDRYNAYILMKIIRRPTWWVILLFIPTINLIMFIVIWVEILRSFGWNSLKNNALVIITLGLYVYTLNYSKNQKYIPRFLEGYQMESPLKVLQLSDFCFLVHLINYLRLN